MTDTRRGVGAVCIHKIKSMRRRRLGMRDPEYSGPVADDGLPSLRSRPPSWCVALPLPTALMSKGKEEEKEEEKNKE